MTCCALDSHADVTTPAWAVDPADAGTNLPSTGQSLFDHITADGVPFPFEALVRKIEAAAGCNPGRCVTSVLMPLGRSLQRAAAAPIFFRFPRVVVAVPAKAAGPCSRRIAFTSVIRNART